MIPSREKEREYGCPVRDVLDRIGDKWSILVLTTLEKQPTCFNELGRMINGVSQRMLTRVLRNLERDGMVARTILPTNPPQVEYSLTKLGTGLCEPLNAMVEWADKNRKRVIAARGDFDAGILAPPSPRRKDRSEALAKKRVKPVKAAKSEVTADPEPAETQESGDIFFW